MRYFIILNVLNDIEFLLFYFIFRLLIFTSFYLLNEVLPIFNILELLCIFRVELLLLVIF
jgi:hypothetical protein